MERFLMAAHPAAQHTNAFLALGQQLRARGHDVAFLAFPSTRSLLQGQGFTTFDSVLFPEARADGAPGRFWSLLPGHARDIARLAHNWNAAAIVADSLFPAAALGAEYAGLPWVTVHTDQLPFPGPGVPPPGSGLPIGEEWGYRGPLALAKAAVNQWREEWQTRAARKVLGLEPAEWTSPSRVSPWLTLALTTEAVEAPRYYLPETLFLVGPCRPLPQVPETTEHLLEQVREDVPRVYISTPRAFDRHPGFFAKLIQGLASLRVQMILDIGAGLPDSRAAGMPPNVVALRGVPHPAVLPRADLIISDGTHDVVTEALLLGKPLLAAPTNAGGADNAARVRYLGAGLHVDPQKTTRFELRSLVERLLKDDACRTRAISLSRSLAFTDGPSVAAGLIERLAFTREPVRRPAGCTPSLFRDSPLPWERRDLLVVH